MFFLLITLLATEPPGVYRFPIQPLPFQDENNPQTFMTGISQVESNGKHLFLVEMRSPWILQIDGEGKFIRRFGGQGNGPKEMGSLGPIAISVNGPSTWVIQDDSKTVHYFENGEHLVRFNLDSYQIRAGGTHAHPFAFDRNRLVIPVFPGRRKLVAVYDYGGNVTQMAGDILPIEREYLATNPGLNTTYWRTDGDRWYCLFKFRPFLRVYDNHFQLQASFQVQGPEVDAFERMYLENEPNKRFTYPPGHFRGLQLVGNYLYTLSDFALYQIDKRTGETTRRVYFYKPNTDQGSTAPNLYFDDFAFLEPNKLILIAAHLPWDVGTWQVDLPFSVR